MGNDNCVLCFKAEKSSSSLSNKSFVFFNKTDRADMTNKSRPKPFWIPKNKKGPSVTTGTERGAMRTH